MVEKQKIQAAIGAEEVEKFTKTVLASVFQNLKDNATVKADGPTRLFFPNGIELISVVFKLNLKDGIVAEVKIAGERGIKGTAIVQGTSDVLSLPDATSAT